MSTIQTNVMAAVFAIRAARMAKSPTALKVYAIVLSVWGISRIVWVSKVFENFSIAQNAGLETTVNYVLAAIGHTQLGVQLMLFVVAIAFVSLISDTLRAAPAGRLAA